MRQRGRKDDIEYRTLVEQVPAVVYVGSSEEMGVLYISPQVGEMLGHAQEEWFSDPHLWLKAVHPEDRERVLAERTRVYGTGKPFEIEYRLVARDGREVWVRQESVRAPDEGGRPSGLWRGAMVDITGFKRAEESLRESEERFRLVARATGEAIWDNDLLTGKQEWDGATEALFGYPAHGSVSGEWWEERIHPEDKGRVLSGLEAVLEGDAETWADEYRFLRADGSYATVMDRGHVARDAEGSAVRMVGSIADVTEKRLMEAEVRESEERFRLAFEAANVGMAHAAPDGHWLRVNGKMCEILGYEREEFMGLTFYDLISSEEPGASWERVERMLKGRLGPRTVESRYVRKDGSRVWASLAVSPVRKEPSEEPDYFVCVVDDITGRKLEELIPDPLIPRELEVLKLIVRWQTNKDIARRLNFSTSTIKQHVHNILAKLKVENRRQAATRAVEIGLIPPPR